jgi:hypothetical protein
MMFAAKRFLNIAFAKACIFPPNWYLNENYSVQMFDSFGIEVTSVCRRINHEQTYGGFFSRLGIEKTMGFNTKMV